MGFIIYKINAGTSTAEPDTKQRLIFAISRVCDILYTGAKKTINLVAEEPMEINFKSTAGAPVSRVATTFTPELMKDLAESGYFTIKVNVSNIQVIFTYDQSIHMENSCSIELKGQFPEYTIKYAWGFILDKEAVASQWSYDRAADKVERLKGLIFSVMKKFLGEGFFSSISKSTIQQYARDAVYFNLFGFQFTIRRKY